MSLRVALLLVVVVALAGCKKSRKDECKELTDLAMAFADGMSKSLGDGKSISGDPEIKAKMKELHDQCMTWPDDVFECMRANDETSPKCVEAMSHVTGVVSTNVDKAPKGPEIVASATLGETDWDGMTTSLATDGTLTAATKTFVTAYTSNGSEKWRTPLENEGWLVDLNDGSFLVGSREHELVALDGETGDVRWRIAIPTGSDEYGDRKSEGAVLSGEHALVALADGRFLRVDPASCTKKKQKGCIEQAFALTDESLYEPKLLALGGGSDVVVGSSNHVRRFKDGKLIASIYVRDDFGGFASLGGTKVTVTMDDELVLWDLAKCPATPVILPRKQGRMYMRGEGDCDDCVAPPRGCLVARSELEDVDNETPHVLRDGSIMVSNMEGPARAAVNGNKHWVSEVDAVGPMREVGDTVVFVSRGDDGQPAKLVALDTATGKAKWVRALAGVESSEISYSTDPLVETAGSWLVAGAKGRVSWIKLSTKI